MAETSFQIIREYMIADESDALFLDVGKRIDSIGLTEDNKPANNQAHIVMARRGGQNTDRLSVASPSVMFRIFSGTGSIKNNSSGPRIAGEIYENFKTRMHNINGKTTTSGFIVSSFEEQPPQDLVDPDFKFPFVLAFYSIMTRNKS